MNDVKYLKAFIIYTVIAVIVGLVAGAVQGSILGFILGAFAVDLGVIQIITGITGFLVGAVASYFIFRWVIAKFILPQVIASVR